MSAGKKGAVADRKIVCCCTFSSVSKPFVHDGSGDFYIPLWGAENQTL